MKLDQAIASGMPFKRKGEEDIKYRTVTNKRADIFSAEDIMAADWVIDAPTVKISEMAFWDAVKATRGSDVGSHWAIDPFADRLAQELGITQLPKPTGV